MMNARVIEIPSREAAEAFICGMRYTHDEAIKGARVEKDQHGLWAVIFTDEKAPVGVTLRYPRDL